MIKYQLDNLDRKILEMLSDNARIPYLEIARENNVSGAAVHQRIQKLITAGVIKGFATHINPAALGYDTCAYIGFFLSNPSDSERVTNELYKIPEVVEVHYATGKYDLLVKLYARNNSHLLQLIHDCIQPLCAGRTETLISFKEEFCRSIPVNELCQN